MSAFQVQNLKFGYSSQKTILNIPKLEISKGETIFIHGPSGSGKSTLLNLLAGVLSPQAGEMKVLEQNYAQMSSFERDRFRGDHIGFIFQSFNLISYLSLAENIMLPCLSSSTKAKKITSTLEEEVKRISLPLSLSEFLNQPVSSLSVGQQQRVAVARALMGSPEIIIADEPTSSLDEDVTEQFMQLLLDEQKKNNFTLLFVSHDSRLQKFFETSLSLKELNRA